MTATLPFIATVPLLPPVGFLSFVLWRELRPDLLPPWSALGFGLFDDLVSGNPMGTALLLWPVVGLALTTSERWFLFRTWRHDWLVSSGAALLYLLALWSLAWASGDAPPATSLVLPALLSVVLLPPLLRLATGPGLHLRSRR